MELEIRPLKKKDYDKTIQFAITGMNFDRYMGNKTFLNLYGRYFWNMETARASQMIAAYYGDELAGVLLADMKDEKKPYGTFLGNLYIWIFDFMQRIFVKDGVVAYNNANREMLMDFEKKHSPDGELCFLAANPGLTVKGVGTLLLNELEKRERGKQIYLFTDSNCTWQFYEHRGFERSEERNITMDFIDKKNVPLSCYLYSKVCGQS